MSRANEAFSRSPITSPAWESSSKATLRALGNEESRSIKNLPAFRTASMAAMRRAPLPIKIATASASVPRRSPIAWAMRLAIAFSCEKVTASLPVFTAIRSGYMSTIFSKRSGIDRSTSSFGKGLKSPVSPQERASAVSRDCWERSSRGWWPTLWVSLIAAAIFSTVGESNRTCRGSSEWKFSITRVTILVAASEWPPRSKKLSWMPTRSTPRISAQMSANCRSSSQRGAMKGVSRTGRVSAGSGRAARSTLFCGLSGMLSNLTKAAGIMCSGSVCAKNLTNALTVGTCSEAVTK